MSEQLFGARVWKNSMLEKDFHEMLVTAMRYQGWSCYSVPDSRRVSLAGYPDVTAWRGTRLIFAELKREKGKTSPAQDEVLAELAQIPCAEVYVWKPSDWPDIEEIISRNK